MSQQWTASTVPFVALLGTSDPYVKGQLVSQVTNAIAHQETTFKSSKHKKTLNPQWPAAKYHYWLYALPVELHLELFDHDLIGSDDFLGTVTIRIDEKADGSNDTWYQLQKRPGKEKQDKAVKGEVRVKIRLQYKELFTWTPETLFSDGDFVAFGFPRRVNPVNFNIMGKMNELQLLTTLISLQTPLPLPKKVFLKQTGEFLNWELTLTRGELTASFTKEKFILDLIQEVALRVMSALASFGFSASSETPNRMEFNYREIWLVKNMPVISGSKFILIETSYLPETSNYQVDLQGDLEPELVALLKDTFEVHDYGFTSKAGHHHTCWGLVIHAIKTFGFLPPDPRFEQSERSPLDRKRNNVLQNFLLRVGDALKRMNYSHATAFDKAHIFVRYPNHTPSSGPFVLLDPANYWDRTGGGEPRNVTHIELQGSQVTQQFAVQIAQNLDYHEGAQISVSPTELKGKALYWSLSVPDAFLPWVATPDRVKTHRNQFENAQLRGLNALSRLGYHFVSAVEQDSFLLQHQPTLPPTTYLFLDPQSVGRSIELQGADNFAPEVLQQLSKACGLKAPVRNEETLTKRLLAWSFPELMSDDRGLHLLKIISWLHNNTKFEFLTQNQTELILLRHNPALPAGQFLRITGSWETFHFIGDTADGLETLVQSIAQVIGSPRGPVGGGNSWKVHSNLRERVSDYHISIKRTLALWSDVISYLVKKGWELKFHRPQMLGTLLLKPNK